MKKIVFLILCALTFLSARDTTAQSPRAAGRVARDVGRFPAPDARQGIAVDGSHLYVIANRSVAKYTKDGEMVARWEGEPDGPIQHLNGGIVRQGNLYAAASNYPNLPMISSIEIWDVMTMEHVESISFGIYSGSATWIDFYNGSWWIAFANYENEAGEPGRGVEWTTIERFDTDWRRTGGWVLPAALVEKFRPYSNSGGVWTQGELWLTGHDAPEIYAVRLPRAGAVLELVETIPAPIAGQGIAIDPIFPRRVYAIDRSTREVVILEVE
jgi:hypothetical protein